MPISHTTKSILKKCFFVSLSLFLLILLVLASIPFWFNIDHYRPELVSFASRHINGKVEIGNLSLSAWGKFRIKVDGLEIDDEKGERVLSAKSIFAEAPLVSIFSEGPALTVISEKPEVHVVKNNQGNMNVLGLFKASSVPEKEEGSKRVERKSQPTTKAGGDTNGLPLLVLKWLNRAQFKMDIKQAYLSYLDAKTQTKSELKNINILVSSDFKSTSQNNIVGNINGEIGLGEIKMYIKTHLASLAPLQAEISLSSPEIDFGTLLQDMNGGGIKKTGMVFSKLESLAQFNSGLLSVKFLKGDLFGGHVKLAGELNLTAPKPVYKFSSQVQDLKLDEAVASQSEILKKLVVGKVQVQFTGQGEGFDPEKAKARLSGKGSFKVTEAKFVMFDVGQMVSQGVVTALGKIWQKIPVLKDKELPKTKVAPSQYEFISSDFSIQNGVVEAPNFQAKAVNQKGLDLKGRTQIKLASCDLKADWQIVDTYNLTKVRDQSVVVSGVKVDHVLAQGDNPVILPIHVAGPCRDPKVDYGAMTESLMKVALNNLGRAATQKVTHEVTKRLQDELSKKAESTLKDAIKGIFGK
jgi:uncharacterized protein involved in outer membrane biogenesis